MKKFATILCTAALTFGMINTAFAAPSIGQLIPEAPVVISTEVTIPDGLVLDVKDAAPDKYENATVTDVVKLFNDDDDTTVVSVMDVLEALKDSSDKALDPAGEIKTYHEGTVIDPEEYEPLMPFVDLILTDGVDVFYDLDGTVVKVKATFKAEVAKDLNEEDLLLMQIDPVTGEVYFVEIEEYDPVTGEITAEFPCLGPFTILEKGTQAE